MAKTALVKKEKLDPTELDGILIEFCKSNPEGITGPLLRSSLPHLDFDQCVLRLTHLTREGKLSLYKKGKINLFKYREAIEAVKGTKFENEIEKAIYETIAASGSKGIWIKDLRESMDIPQQQCITALKSLKAKELVKEVTAGSGLNKRIWMLFNLEPDSELVLERGGPWFNESNGEYEPDVGNSLTELALAVLTKKAKQSMNDPGGPLTVRNKSYVTPDEIHQLVVTAKVIKVPIQVEHIQIICDNLYFERKAEKKVTSNGTIYRIAKPVMETGFSQVPCGFCPLMEECHEDAVVSPLTCEYYKKWLKDAETADLLTSDLTES